MNHDESWERSEEILACVESARKWHKERGIPYDPDNCPEGEFNWETGEFE